ncbi:MAG: hypothetical protein EXR48_01300 [Dehalococcoidia bacterium]|nr:hypothetical protein [Dehalococcoidia bacterium]
MDKPQQRARAIHLKTETKRRHWRQLARQLLKGQITLPQMERLAGPSARNVLRTAAYLLPKETMTPPSLVAQAISRAIAPALADTAFPKPALPTAEAPAAPRAVVAAPAAAPRPKPRAGAAKAPRHALAEKAPAGTAGAPPAEETALHKPARRVRAKATSEGAVQPAPEQAPTPAAPEAAKAPPRKSRRRAGGDAAPIADSSGGT